MDKKGAQTAVLISAVASFGIVSIHDIMKGKANAKAYIGGAFVFLVLAAGADVEPGIAGPFAYLVLTGVALTDGTSVFKAIGNAKSPVGDQANVVAPTGLQGPIGPAANGITGGSSNPVSPLDPGNSGGIIPSPTLGGTTGDPLGQLIVKEAMRFQGVPYVFGGASPSGFDCSGLVYYLAQKYAGITLPRTSQAQSQVGTPINLSQIQPGDLVFFTFSKAEGGEGTPNDHEGIYVGSGKFIQAPHTGDNVKISALSGSYLSHLTAIRRVF
jgi:NlpC/P60 family